MWKRSTWTALTGLAMAAAIVWVPAQAKVSAQEAAKLGGPKLTCMGAERAGSADGMVPAFSGKWSKDYPGYRGGGVFSPGPYADEKPLFVITAKNMAKYASHLTPGQEALFKAYPDVFRIPVYPSHRDFHVPKWVCGVAKKNATTAEIVHNGLGFTGTAGGPAFPIPSNGIQLWANIIAPFRAWTEESIQDQAAVYPDDKIAWGRVKYTILAPTNNPSVHAPIQKTVGSFYRILTLKPARQYGTIVVGTSPTDFKISSQQTWIYSPGTRRVRQAPFFGFDTPQGAGGLRTVDEDRLFNGSPIRYKWTLKGKKEIFVPYDVFGINSPKISYKDLLTESTINPKYMRYEMHRVWVLQADLKPKYRHIYKKRVIYIDEDTWLPLLADEYDDRGNLWRVGVENYFWEPTLQGMQDGVAVYHDLVAKAYLADRLVNHSGMFWKINAGGLTPSMFSPSAAAASGN